MSAYQGQPVLQAALIAHQYAADTHAAYIAQQYAMGTMGSLLADRHVCSLDQPFALALGLPPTALQVSLSYNQLQPIARKHEISVGGNPEVITRRIATALATPRYIRKHRTLHEWALIGFLSDASRYLQVAMKFVPASAARSKEDELWVATAFFVGRRTLQRRLRTGDLVPFDATGGTAHAWYSREV